MKLKLPAILMFGFLFLGLSFTSSALPTTTVEKEGMLVEKAEKTNAFTKWVKKSERKWEKRITKWSAKASTMILKAERFATKMGIDLKDPVKKWMWYWILAWALSLVLYILAVVIAVGTSGTGFGASGLIYTLASLLSLAGTVFFVVWLVKEFA